ncbi:hypothetical protein HPC49_00135 [Pyxidicoccus fallax]|uniref:Lipoprotein n=1 Tax=Pyxidicoccus fallax TaxID=394095 RepID=A0A848L5W7_9BACT|nr:hypothetical protein [Pyxidicoccus fallax]NMO14006.1 hypothetical protein [Pyxidicoccus fallax]NPC76662.1 hypothetical protein [Pyxidicoccus fallax]
MVRRLGLFSGAAVAVLLACSPASAKAPPTPDAGTPAAQDAGSARDKAKPEPEKGESTAASEEGGRCTGKATFCAVYGQTFCSSQPGCAYSFATRTCMGLAPKCETATNPAFCKKIKGCQWQ